MPKFATMNIVGPDGTLVKACEPIPAQWDAEVVADMEKTGAVGSKKVAEDAWVASLKGIDKETAAILHLIAAKVGGK